MERLGGPFDSEWCHLCLSLSLSFGSVEGPPGRSFTGTAGGQRKLCAPWAVGHFLHCPRWANEPLAVAQIPLCTLSCVLPLVSGHRGTWTLTLALGASSHAGWLAGRGVREGQFLCLSIQCQQHRGKIARQRSRREGKAQVSAASDQSAIGAAQGRFRTTSGAPPDRTLSYTAKKHAGIWC